MNQKETVRVGESRLNMVSQCCGKPAIPEIDITEHGATGLCSGCREWTGFEPAACPECGGPPDERVLGGMKCGPCAYGSQVGDPDMAEQERSDAAAEAWETKADAYQEYEKTGDERLRTVM